MPRPEAMADQLYLIAHDDRTGRALVDARPLRRGLAGALLCELVVRGCAAVRGDVLHVPVDAQTPPGLLRDVWWAVAREPRRLPVVEWIRFLGLEAVEDVRERLLAGGWLTRARSTRLLRRGAERFPPVDGNTAVWPAMRLSGALTDGPARMSLADAVLACLVEAVGLMDVVVWLTADHCPGRGNVHRVRAGLLADPRLADLAQVLTGVERAIGEGVISRP